VAEGFGRTPCIGARQAGPLPEPRPGEQAEADFGHFPFLKADPECAGTSRSGADPAGVPAQDHDLRIVVEVSDSFRQDRTTA
jgi:hypothetical protein